MPPHPHSIVVAEEVSDAVASGRAAVALESSLIAHGLPWPENLEAAALSEAAVRRGGAVPATVAVLGGRVRVGLSPGEIEGLARDGAGPIAKASRRDLAAIVARNGDAATTVSATLWAARAVGLRVMATGGLGGVHRGASSSFDVSADLAELARSDGALVVCSGVKSILDVPATLELLETLGVAVVGYRTDTFPGFTTISSGLPLSHRVDDPAAAARLVRSHRELAMPGAVVLAQPVAAEVALDAALMESALAAALAEAASLGVAGPGVTPFLLDRLRGSTGGRSLVANKALIVANAGLAGEVAAALAP